MAPPPSPLLLLPHIPTLSHPPPSNCPPGSSLSISLTLLFFSSIYLFTLYLTLNLPPSHKQPLQFFFQLSPSPSILFVPLDLIPLPLRSTTSASFNPPMSFSHTSFSLYSTCHVPFFFIIYPPTPQFSIPPTYPPHFVTLLF